MTYESVRRWLLPVLFGFLPVTVSTGASLAQWKDFLARELAIPEEQSRIYCEKIHENKDKRLLALFIRKPDEQILAAALTTDTGSTSKRRKTGASPMPKLDYPLTLNHQLTLNGRWHIQGVIGEDKSAITAQCPVNNTGLTLVNFALNPSDSDKKVAIVLLAQDEGDDSDASNPLVLKPMVEQEDSGQLYIPAGHLVVMSNHLKALDICAIPATLLLAQLALSRRLFHNLMWM